MDPWQIVAGLAAAIGTAIGASVRAFLRGDVVAGKTYREDIASWRKVADDERKARQLAERRADKADVQVARNTEAVLDMTATVKLSMARREPLERTDG